jgi:hypothetical protein
MLGLFLLFMAAMTVLWLVCDIVESLYLWWRSNRD